MTEQLHLSLEHRAVIEALLRAHLPGVEVWAYGSRVSGRSHEGSDLDLVLRGPGLKEIRLDQMRDFEAAVRDSTIPFLVEARDWARLPERFRREIERGHVVLVREESFQGIERSTQCLGDVAEIVMGQSPRGESVSKYHGIALLNGPTEFGSHHPIPVQFTNDPRRYAEKGDLLFCVRGSTTGRMNWADQRYAIGRGVAAVRHRQEIELQPLIRAAIESGLAGLLSQATGSTFPNVTAHQLASIPYPNLDAGEQRAIAHILGTLDDKMELNRRTNEILEAVARALFKSWFVDFDPVRAKAVLRRHAAHHPPGPITPPLRGSRGGKGASPQSSRWGDIGAAPPSRPWSDGRRQYTPKAQRHAQAMRQNQTSPEGLLWYYLRNKQLGGYKFRRQQPIGPYIADFACLPEKLLIELDGGQHADPTAPDAQRDRFLRQQGYRVLRFWNHDVFADCFGVLERVYEALTDPPPSQPAPDGLASSTPPQGGSDWNIDRARAYLDRMDPEIAALFPDRFVDTELGEIPEGWEIRRIEDVAERIAMGPFGSSIKVSTFVDEGIPVISGQHLNGTILKDDQFRFITEEHAEKLKKANVQRGDIILTHAGNIGQVSYVPQTSQFERYVISQRQFYLRCDLSQILPSFVVYFFKSSQGQHALLANTSSTGVPSISRPVTYLRSIKVSIPPKPICERFHDAVSGLHLRTDSNTAVSRLLIDIRNILLPKLMSGELRFENWWGEKTLGCR